MRNRIKSGRKGLFRFTLLAMLALSASACGKENRLSPDAETKQAAEVSAEETAGTMQETGKTEAKQGEAVTVQETAEKKPETSEMPQLTLETAQTEAMEGDTRLVSASYQTVTPEMPERFPELGKALSSFNEQQKAAAEQFCEENREAAQEALSAGGEAFLPYESAAELAVERADQKLVSLKLSSYTNTGGAHPFSETDGISFWTETGDIVTLSDVVKDREALYETLLEKLRENEANLREEMGAGSGTEDSEAFSVYFEGWEEAVRDEVMETPACNADDNAAVQLRFWITEEGMEVTFPPYDLAPYAVGTISVTLPFAEYPELFSDAVKK